MEGLLEINLSCWANLIDFKMKMRCFYRYSGKVILLKQSSGVVRVKVKFDLHKQDKFDKW